jgi:hypothetical protein
MIGYLASQLHLRIRLNRTDTYLDALRKTVREFHSAVIHEDFDRVPDFVHGWETNGTDLHFNWLPQYGAQPPFDYGQDKVDEFQVEPFPFRATWPFNFLPLFSETAEGIRVVVNYSPRAFSTEAVDCFMQNMRASAEAFVTSPTGRIEHYREYGTAAHADGF